MSHCLRNLIFLLVTVAISLISGVVKAQKEESWCVAIESSPENKLQIALDWACVEGGANCSKIESDGECFLPNTVKDHASYAFNSYYQKMKHQGATCYFNSTAFVSNIDPSHNRCKFEYIP